MPTMMLFSGFETVLVIFLNTENTKLISFFLPLGKLNGMVNGEVWFHDHMVIIYKSRNAADW